MKTKYVINFCLILLMLLLFIRIVQLKNIYNNFDIAQEIMNSDLTYTLDLICYKMKLLFTLIMISFGSIFLIGSKNYYNKKINIYFIVGNLIAILCMLMFIVILQNYDMSESYIPFDLLFLICVTISFSNSLTLIIIFFIEKFKRKKVENN